MVADLKEGTSAAPAPAQRSLIWRMTFPGETDQPGRVRALLKKVLRGHPDLDEILLAASELSTNAVRHTRSGRHGGCFSVEVTAIGTESLLVGVTDEGSATVPRVLAPAPTEPGSRGLQVVQNISRRFGVTGDEEGRTVWALFAPLVSAVPGADGPC